MKPLILVLASITLFASPLWSNDEPLTARELAHHLGVTSWVSKLQLKDTGMILQVFHVVDGKVIGSLIGSHVFPTDREFTRVAILASQTSSGTLLSIQVEAAAATRRQVESFPLQAWIQATVPLPPIIEVGEYVLGGDVSLPKTDNQGNPQPTIKDIKKGLLLRVTKEI